MAPCVPSAGLRAAARGPPCREEGPAIMTPQPQKVVLACLTFIALVLAASSTLLAEPGSPAGASSTPDISVDEITLDRLDFRRGDTVKIRARVRRESLSEPVVVRCYVDVGRVQQVASAETILENHADFTWTATYDARDSTIIIGAYVEAVPGEENLDNNGLWTVHHSYGQDDEDGASPPAPGVRYGRRAHEHVAREAIKLSNIPEVSHYADIIAHGAVKEDRFPDLVYGVSWFFGLSTLWTRHFWDVDKGEDGRGLWGRESSLEKGRAYLRGWRNNPGLYTLYAQGEKDLAYEYLGRVIHLMEDAFSPAHVHLDAHVIDDDETEKWGEKHFTEYTYEMAGAPYDGETFVDILTHAAQLGDSLPSDDVEGDLVGFEDPGGWLPRITREEIITWNRWGWDRPRPEGMKKQFDRAIPAAISHVAGMIRLFWRTTHPGEDLPEPALSGQVTPSSPDAR